MIRTLARRALLITAFVLCLVPYSAHAHATPIQYVPDSSAILDSAPTSVVIHFSERLDEGASEITVKGPNGDRVSAGVVRVDANDPRTLSVPLTNGGTGMYTVTWSVVSADDGHFTKGAYPFAVGAALDATIAMQASSVEVVTITSVTEELAMTLELFGNGLLWAVLLLYIFALRPLLKTGTYTEEEKLIKKGYTILLALGVVCVVIGAVFQIGIKTDSLATLRSVGFFEALPLYLQTAAGFATVVRLLVGVFVGIVFLFGRKIIHAAKKITPYEIGMILAMFVFAYFRAKISHATANPFFPELSIAVNFVHLIEKDFWAGAVGILALMSVFKSLRSFLSAVLPKVFSMLAVNFVLTSLTASYIVWLHLKSFGNLLSTGWGNVFLELLCAAVLLVGIRVYHVVARLKWPQFFERLLPATLSAEFAVGLLVIFYSSVVIVTSPPLSAGTVQLAHVDDQKVSITLERPQYETGTLLLTLSGENNLKTPVLIVQNPGDEELSVDVTKRFEGGYAFPSAFLSGDGPFSLSVTVPQDAGYDAHALFTLNKSDIAPASGHAEKRTFDSFTFSMFGIAVLAVLFALVILYLSQKQTVDSTTPRRTLPELFAVFTFLAVAYGVAYGITALGSSPLVNPYKAQCVADGNMWHLMLPMKAGVPTSDTAGEGCMWGMGDFEYQFVDKREYDTYREMPQATVSLEHTPESLSVGVPSKLLVSLKNADGTPATLFVDMEKLLHMVIVSEDETVFAHIHADDYAPLTPEAIKNSNFEFHYTFPKAGKYLVSVDYAHGVQLESKQFTVDVSGVPTQSDMTSTYAEEGTFHGYDVSLKYDSPLAGVVNTLRFNLTKDGKSVTDVKPYLSAASHISVVKNDLSAFLHVHGEVHPPGTPYPPIIVKNGKVVHSMAMMILPPTFGPNIEAHVIFPSAGVYTIWAEFNVEGAVIPTSFTVRVN